MSVVSARDRLQRALDLFKIALIIVLIYVLLSLTFNQTNALIDDRAIIINQFQSQRNSRVIALIHRKETVSVAGVPVSTFIDVEDSESILRAIRRTSPDTPIDLIVHTPGGLVLAASQIASALAKHKAKVTVFVPHYAMSGGTLIALAADEVVMDSNAVLGPVDPQLGQYPAASLINLANIKPKESISDDMWILIDNARKSMNQVRDFVEHLLVEKGYQAKQAKTMALTFTDGRWTHDFPLNYEYVKSLGLKVSSGIPDTIHQLMELYPQAQAERPSVLYLPFTGKGELETH